jgi:Zn-dependent protease
MLQVARVAGIPVRVDVSWFLVFALLSWSLAAGYFPHVLPGLSPRAAWLQGIAASALLFLSVLLHELAHAVVARHHGVRVNGIRLHVFGGVSELQTEPPSPRAEFAIAAVGPLASFAIAAIFYGLGRAVAHVPWAIALTGYLAVVNLVLGLFNLVPGFPLDGGRLLRAMLWWWSGGQGWATRWASRVGAAFALMLVGLGIVRAIGGEALGGVWFVLLGLFLYQAARASADIARLRERLEPMVVADVMTPLTTAVEGLAPLGRDDAVVSGASAWTAYLALSRRGAPRIAVVDDGRLVGVVTHADLLRNVLAADDVQAPAGRRAA